LHSHLPYVTGTTLRGASTYSYDVKEGSEIISKEINPLGTAEHANKILRNIYILITKNPWSRVLEKLLVS
jgi:hypothetical protein